MKAMFLFVMLLVCVRGFLSVFVVVALLNTIEILSLTWFLADQPELPHGWERRQEKSGKKRVYYVDKFTKTTRWECPSPLPTGFERKVDKRGRIFFVDHVTKVIQTIQNSVQKSQVHVTHLLLLFLSTDNYMEHSR